MKKTTSTSSLNKIVCDLAEIFNPPERLSVSEAAEKYVRLNNPGSYVGPWMNETTPYMCEPMDTLASREFSGCIFAGPAQSAKTQALLLNWMAYTVKVEPMDMILYSPTTAMTRDFAIRRVDRLNRHSPAIGSLLSKRKDEDNKSDKMYSNGTIISLSWPSVSTFAGRPVGRVALTDYDRMDDDIDGDGAPYDLASKRTTTFGSFAMALAESSPSRPILDHNWIPTTPHEAPPCLGILGLYNRGDRRRYQWPCYNCGHFFEGDWPHLTWEPTADVLAAAESVRMVCPNPRCGHAMPFTRRSWLYENATWVRDGQRVCPKTWRLRGEPARSNIASFWLKGPAAAFVSWPKLVEMYLIANAEFERTGNEDSLRKFYNNDCALPYVEKSRDEEMQADTLMKRARPIYEKVVPKEVRFLIATVDVQKNMFVVQVQGIAPGTPFDMHVIDRFDIRKSKRTDHDDDREWVKPGSYLEDWYAIRDEVISRTYPLEGVEGGTMRVRLTLCDSGGEDGVTSMAYAFWRELRKEGLAGRFHLLKGGSRPAMPRTLIEYPDSRQNGPKAGARGDIPVLFLNPTIIKDDLANRLRVEEDGKGKIHFPAWLPEWFYKELCSEHKVKGKWEKKETGKRRRNEAWDLLYYCIGGCVSSLIGVENIDWRNATSYAAPWETNPLVTMPRPKEAIVPQQIPRYSFAELGKALG